MTAAKSSRAVTSGRHAVVEDLRVPKKRRGTSTMRFGSSKRESHDASGFYERFVAPEISPDSEVGITDKVDVLYCADARQMSDVADNSVALVVTSPPYFAGKEYEEALGQNGVPATYFEYLKLLHDVFAECKRVLEPGGRMAINVANLGRRPYRSLAGDIAQILEELGLLLRGEVVWWKGRAAGSSCAWGTFQRPNNPVMRDVTERIVLASKGRFDRALTASERLAQGLPSMSTISRDEFLEATTDLWEIPPESATRVGHPAPFPVELPQRLIELYTYEDDVVLDPFMGSGSTAIAAIRTDRHYIGFDTDPAYVKRARSRLKQEREATNNPKKRTPVRVAAKKSMMKAPDEAPLDTALREGRKAKEVALLALEAGGFTDIDTDVRIPAIGIDLAFLATDEVGQRWAFDLSGSFVTGRSGLRRSDAVWKAIGKASLFASWSDDPLVLLTTDLPVKGSSNLAAIEQSKGPGKPIFDVVDILNPEDLSRLQRFAKTGAEVSSAPPSPQSRKRGRPARSK